MRPNYNKLEIGQETFGNWFESVQGFCKLELESTKPAGLIKYFKINHSWDPVYTINVKTCIQEDDSEAEHAKFYKNIPTAFNDVLNYLKTPDSKFKNTDGYDELVYRRRDFLKISNKDAIKYDNNGLVYVFSKTGRLDVGNSVYSEEDYKKHAAKKDYIWENLYAYSCGTLPFKFAKQVSQLNPKNKDLKQAVEIIRIGYGMLDLKMCY